MWLKHLSNYSDVKHRYRIILYDCLVCWGTINVETIFQLKHKLQLPPKCVFMCNSYDYFNICQDNGRMCIKEYDAVLLPYPSLSGAPRPPSLPSIRADDSSSRLGSSIYQTLGRPQLLDLREHINLLRFWVCGVYVWEGIISRPHQRTAAFDGGCVWAPSAPGSSSSGLPGWCWSPSVRFPASQRWPVSHSQQTLTVMDLFLRRLRSRLLLQRFGI